ncbi:transmembrane protein 276 [Vidua macroura]|uniref:transmembrane protein 276 n=1 Tax=Vidua macroura TaxID=187451 RepID=UPI0023A7D3F8|nr:transmembrane protein 276 [Vidua macroura]
MPTDASANQRARRRRWPRPFPGSARRCRKCRSPPVSPSAMGDTGVALSHALLCVTSLGCALRARQVTGGPAAGFLLQALVAASDALSPPSPPSVPDVPEPPPGSWICSVLAQPLVAFGCHRLSGDAATRQPPAGLGRRGGRGGLVVAGRWPRAAGSLCHCADVRLGAGAGGADRQRHPARWRAALVALGDAVAPWGVPWVRVAASVALLGTLREQGRALRGHR